MMTDITIEELKDRIEKKENLIIVDVREPWEYEEFNIGAKLIPLATLDQSLDQLSEHKNAEIIIHCKSGRRSATAQSFLRQQGFTNVRNLIGGIDAWKANYC